MGSGLARRQCLWQAVFRSGSMLEWSLRCIWKAPIGRCARFEFSSCQKAKGGKKEEGAGLPRIHSAPGLWNLEIPSRLLEHSEGVLRYLLRWR